MWSLHRRTSHAISLMDATAAVKRPDTESRRLILGRCGLLPFILIGQQALESNGSDGATEEPALPEDGLPQCGKILCLLPGFDPFHDYLQVERPGHGQNLRQNARSHRLRVDSPREAPVDFDGVHGKFVQIRKAGIPGTEVVDMDAVALLAKTQNGRDGHL